MAKTLIMELDKIKDSLDTSPKYYIKQKGEVK